MDILNTVFYRNIIRLMDCESNNRYCIKKIKEAFHKQVQKIRDDNSPKVDDIDLRVIYYFFKRAYEYKSMFIATQLYMLFSETDPNNWFSNNSMSLFLQILIKMNNHINDPPKYAKYGNYYTRDEIYFINPTIFFTFDTNVLIFLLNSIDKYEPQISLTLYELGVQIVDQVTKDQRIYIYFDNLIEIFSNYYQNTDVLINELYSLEKYSSEVYKRTYKDKFIREATKNYLRRINIQRGNYAEIPHERLVYINAEYNDEVKTSQLQSIDKSSNVDTISDYFFKDEESVIDKDFSNIFDEIAKQLNDTTGEETEDNYNDPTESVGPSESIGTTTGLYNEGFDYNNQINTQSNHLIPSNYQELDLFRRFGPSNHFISEIGYTSSRMLLNRDYEDSNIEDEQGFKDWFLGSCDQCLRGIREREHAVRLPKPFGGWEGCFCSWNCVREFHKQEYFPDEYVSVLISIFEYLVNQYGIYNTNS